ncbi:diguanylate cyclase [Paraburkholderia sp.]|uniref:diguanylate cyclase domain-containing protein n=1 Tax=Paraburkholderia sp. TaxID=1926495 RepID=UPI0023A55C36|nr:diguanylate cyclase [Paraburkholderia sp.]MDE1184588.1 diguanylate cyclase [Paraburkholderia sp.]
MSSLFRRIRAVRHRYLALFAALVVGLLVAAAVFMYEARALITDSARGAQAFDVLAVGNRMLHDLETAESAQRGYLLTRDERYLDPYRRGLLDLDQSLPQLQQLVSADERSVELVRRIEQAMTAKRGELARTVDLAQDGNRGAALTLMQTGEGRVQMERLHADVAQLLDTWREIRASDRRDMAAKMIDGAVALAALALLIGWISLASLVSLVAGKGMSQATLQGITGRKPDEMRDPLTGLPNRRRLLAVLNGLAEQPVANRIALLYLDIDGFSHVNDALGHQSGDRLLQRVGEALRGATRQQDLLVRLGGDAYALLAVNCGDDAQLRDLAGRLIARVMDVGEREYARRFPIGACVGIATYPDRADSVGQLLGVAETATRTAKQAGRSTYRFGSAQARGRANVVPLAR